jgi:hypothetical protein
LPGPPNPEAGLGAVPGRAGAATDAAPRTGRAALCGAASNIRHLTDVSHCKLHQHLCCNPEIKCQAVVISPGAGRAERQALSRTGSNSLVRKQMDTMAPIRRTALHQPNRLTTLQNQTPLQKPLRPTVLQKRRVTLPAGPTAPGRARGQVRATIEAWEIPVDPSIAVLLTSELVTNAVRHEKGDTITLVLTCAYGQLHVDVHDTSYVLPEPVNGPPDAETGRGLMLVASLSSSWGYYGTPTGKAVYFTLAFSSGHENSTEPSGG